MAFNARSAGRLTTRCHSTVRCVRFGVRKGIRKGVRAVNSQGEHLLVFVSCVPLPTWGAGGSRSRRLPRPPAFLPALWSPLTYVRGPPSRNAPGQSVPAKKAGWSHPAPATRLASSIHQRKLARVAVLLRSPQVAPPCFVLWDVLFPPLSARSHRIVTRRSRRQGRSRGDRARGLRRRNVDLQGRRLANLRDHRPLAQPVTAALRRVGVQAAAEPTGPPITSFPISPCNGIRFSAPSSAYPPSQRSYLDAHFPRV